MYSTDKQFLTNSTLVSLKNIVVGGAVNTGSKRDTKRLTLQALKILISKPKSIMYDRLPIHILHTRKTMPTQDNH